MNDARAWVDGKTNWIHFITSRQRQAYLRNQFAIRRVLCQIVTSLVYHQYISFKIRCYSDWILADLPLVQITSIACEPLDPVVPRVCNKHIVIVTNCNRHNHAELSVARSIRSPFRDILTILCILDYPLVAHVCDIDIAFGVGSDSINVVGQLCISGFAPLHFKLTIR